MWLVKSYWPFASSKIFIYLFIFLCIHNMYLISAEGYKNESVNILRVQKTGEIWPSVGSDIGVKNIFDLALKEIYGICETKNPT